MTGGGIAFNDKSMLENEPFVAPCVDAALDGIWTEWRDLLFEECNDTSIVSKDVMVWLQHDSRKDGVKDMNATEI